MQELFSSVFPLFWVKIVPSLDQSLAVQIHFLTFCGGCDPVEGRLIWLALLLLAFLLEPKPGFLTVEEWSFLMPPSAESVEAVDDWKDDRSIWDPSIPCKFWKHNKWATHQGLRFLLTVSAKSYMHEYLPFHASLCFHI